jgi:hypothetical protein
VKAGVMMSATKKAKEARVKTFVRARVMGIDECN